MGDLASLRWWENRKNRKEPVMEKFASIAKHYVWTHTYCGCVHGYSVDMRTPYDYFISIHPEEMFEADAYDIEWHLCNNPVLTTKREDSI